MAKKEPQKKLKKTDELTPTDAKIAALIDEVQAHEQDSYDELATVRADWDHKEAILAVKLEDSASKGTSSKVFDPVLSSLVYDRAARVMAQNINGQAYAVSKNDVAKNIFMNLLFKYYRNQANDDLSHLIKLRLWDVYSNTYGSMFALVPWRVDLDSGFMGPDINLIEIRNVRPQPGKKSINKSDWFGVRDGNVSLEWLKAQDHEVWNMKEIEDLEAELKANKSQGDVPTASGRENRSYVERTLYPTERGDSVFPGVELYTEYRRGQWITFTPRNVKNDKSRPHILRVVENPDEIDNAIPIVAKHAFPRIDSMIGLGEIERGQSLQLAINSLWNLYMDGVKYSIFPPLHIDPNNVVPSSIKWGAGERMFMNNPNRDVQMMQIAPQGLSTFTTTYNYMMAAIQNQSGSTTVSTAAGSESLFGKTPQAIERGAQKEAARDEWDRIMMEQALNEVYEKWTNMISKNLEVEQAVRVFGPELEDLKKLYPEQIDGVVEMFESGKRGNAKISNEKFKEEDGSSTKFDFEIESGSSFQKDPSQESTYLTSLLETVSKDPNIIKKMNEKGKDIDFAQMMTRIVASGPVKDWDKIVVDYVPTPGTQPIVGPDGQPLPPSDPNAVPVDQAMTPTDQTVPVIPEEQPLNDQIPNGAVPPQGDTPFNDPDIAAAAAAAASGVFGQKEIPANPMIA